MDSVVGDTVVKIVYQDRVPFLGHALTEDDLQICLLLLTTLGPASITNECGGQSADHAPDCRRCTREVTSADGKIKIESTSEGFLLKSEAGLQGLPAKVFKAVLALLEHRYPKVSSSAERPDWFGDLIKSANRGGELVAALGKIFSEFFGCFGLGMRSRAMLFWLALWWVAPNFALSPIRPFLLPEDDQTTGEIDRTPFQARVAEVNVGPYKIGVCIRQTLGRGVKSLLASPVRPVADAIPLPLLEPH